MCVPAEWTVQFGSEGVAGDDSARAVATDASGAVFVAGDVEGTLPLADSAGLGNGDGYIRKYDSGGNLIWSIQLGTPALDSVLALAVDPNGDPVVMGHTDGTFSSFGAPAPASGTSTYLARYSGDTGTELWRYQLPTLATHMAIDWNGAVVLVAVSADGVASVVKNGPTGATLLGIALGGRHVAGLATDREGNILITGGEGDAYVAKYDTGGNFVWESPIVQGNTGLNYATAVCADGAGNVLVVGRTSTLPARAFLGKFNANGVGLWSVNKTGAEAVAVDTDAVGNIFALATLTATVDLNFGVGDFSMYKYTADGMELGARNIGSSGAEWVEAIAVDPSGAPYVVGSTDGVLPGTTSPGGDNDAFLLKLQ